MQNFGLLDYSKSYLCRLYFDVPDPSRRVGTIIDAKSKKPFNFCIIQNPKSEIQNTKSEIRNPKPKIQNPKSKTQNPKPKIQNPKGRGGGGHVAKEDVWASWPPVFFGVVDERLQPKGSRLDLAHPKLGTDVQSPATWKWSSLSRN